ncbi:hypothetical protein ADUPG1_000446, partial [Aduncisulcus paluster]
MQYFNAKYKDDAPTEQISFITTIRRIHSGTELTVLHKALLYQGLDKELFKFVAKSYPTFLQFSYVSNITADNLLFSNRKVKRQDLKKLIINIYEENRVNDDFCDHLFSTFSSHDFDGGIPLVDIFQYTIAFEELKNSFPLKTFVSIYPEKHDMLLSLNLDSSIDELAKPKTSISFLSIPKSSSMIATSKVVDPHSRPGQDQDLSEDDYSKSNTNFNHEEEEEEEYYSRSFTPKPIVASHHIEKKESEDIPNDHLTDDKNRTTISDTKKDTKTNPTIDSPRSLLDAEYEYEYYSEELLEGTKRSSSSKSMRRHKSSSGSRARITSTLPELITTPTHDEEEKESPIFSTPPKARYIPAVDLTPNPSVCNSLNLIDDLHVKPVTDSITTPVDELKKDLISSKDIVITNYSDHRSHDSHESNQDSTSNPRVLQFPSKNSKSEEIVSTPTGIDQDNKVSKDSVSIGKEDLKKSNIDNVDIIPDKEVKSESTINSTNKETILTEGDNAYTSVDDETAEKTVSTDTATTDPIPPVIHEHPLEIKTNCPLELDDFHLQGEEQSKKKFGKPDAPLMSERSTRALDPRSGSASMLSSSSSRSGTPNSFWAGVQEVERLQDTLSHLSPCVVVFDIMALSGEQKKLFLSISKIIQKKSLTSIFSINWDSLGPKTDGRSFLCTYIRKFIEIQVRSDSSSSLPVPSSVLSPAALLSIFRPFPIECLPFLCEILTGHSFKDNSVAFPQSTTLSLLLTLPYPDIAGIVQVVSTLEQHEQQHEIATVGGKGQRDVAGSGSSSLLKSPEIKLMSTDDLRTQREKKMVDQQYHFRQYNTLPAAYAPKFSPIVDEFPGVESTSSSSSVIAGYPTQNSRKIPIAAARAKGLPLDQHHTLASSKHINVSPHVKASQRQAIPIRSATRYSQIPPFKRGVEPTAKNLGGGWMDAVSQDITQDYYDPLSFQYPPIVAGKSEHTCDFGRDKSFPSYILRRQSSQTGGFEESEMSSPRFFEFKSGKGMAAAAVFAVDEIMKEAQKEELRKLEEKQARRELKKNLALPLTTIEEHEMSSPRFFEFKSGKGMAAAAVFAVDEIMKEAQKEELRKLEEKQARRELKKKLALPLTTIEEQWKQKEQDWQMEQAEWEQRHCEWLQERSELADQIAALEKHLLAKGDEIVILREQVRTSKRKQRDLDQDIKEKQRTINNYSKIKLEKEIAIENARKEFESLKESIGYFELQKLQKKLLAAEQRLEACSLCLVGKEKDELISLRSTFKRMSSMLGISGSEYHNEDSQAIHEDVDPSMVEDVFSLVSGLAESVDKMEEIEMESRLLHKTQDDAIQLRTYIESIQAQGLKVYDYAKEQQIRAQSSFQYLPGGKEFGKHPFRKSSGYMDMSAFSSIFSHSFSLSSVEYVRIVCISVKESGNEIVNLNETIDNVHISIGNRNIDASPQSPISFSKAPYNLANHRFMTPLLPLRKIFSRKHCALYDSGKAIIFPKQNLSSLSLDEANEINSDLLSSICGRELCVWFRSTKKLISEIKKRDKSRIKHYESI